MDTLSKKNESASLIVNSSVKENELVKEIIKEKVLKVETPRMRYFDLGEDSSPSYVLGYN